MSKQGLFSFNLQKACIEDESDQTAIQIANNIIIKVNYFQLCKYSKLIQEYDKNDFKEHLISNIQKFKHEYELKDENISIFFKLLQEENVEIIDSQFLDLCVLSKLFEVKSLEKMLQKYSELHMKDIDFAINILLNESRKEKLYIIYPNGEIFNLLEECLVSNIEQCFQKKEFGILPISTIYRIIDKSDKTKLKNDLLYDFIVQSINERYVLLAFVDAGKLSFPQFNALYKGYLDRENSPSKFIYQYLPCNLDYIEELKRNSLVDLIQSKSRYNLLLSEKQKETREMEFAKNIYSYLIEDLHPSIRIERDGNYFPSYHYIFELGDLNIVRYLIKKKKVDLNETLFGKTYFYYACKSGNLDLIKYLIKLNIFDLKAKDKEGKTYLHVACKNGSQIFVKYFINLKVIDINAKDNSGKTILHYACEHGNFELVKYLIELNEIDPNIKDNEGKTILHYASASKNFDLVKYLIDLNIIDPNAKDNKGKTILHYAYQSEIYDIVLYLINQKIVDIKVKDNKGQTFLHYVCESGFLEFVQYLLHLDIFDPTFKDDTGKTILHSACQSRKLELVEFIVSLNKIDINAKFTESENELTALSIAIKEIDEEIAKFLLTIPGIDVNLKFYLEKIRCTPLLLALTSDNDEIILALLSSPNIDVNLTSCGFGIEFAPIVQDACVKNTEIMKLFLENPNTDINIVSNILGHTIEYQSTALCNAISCSNTEIVQLLLSQPKIEVKKNMKHYKYESDDDDDISQKLCDDMTPLFLAVAKGDVDIIHLLLSNPNVDANEKSLIDNCTKSITPLYKAVYDENEKIVEMLLANSKIDVNCTCWIEDDETLEKNVTTALHEGVRTKNIEIIKLLTQRKDINVKVKDGKGRIPADLIEEDDECDNHDNDDEIIKLLSRYNK